MSGATIRCQFRAPREASTVAHEPPPSRAARMLALAHHINCLIDAGQLRDYAEAAQALGLTRARLTQVMNMLLLSPALQEQLLTGDFALTERGLRRVVAEPTWQDQPSFIDSPAHGGQRTEWSALS